MKGNSRGDRGLALYMKHGSIEMDAIRQGRGKEISKIRFRSCLVSDP